MIYFVATVMILNILKLFINSVGLGKALELNEESAVINFLLSIAVSIAFITWAIFLIAG